MRPLSPLNNTISVERIIRSRMIFMGLLCLALFFLLVFRLYYLQILDHETQLRVANQNRIAVRPTPPERGLIYSFDNQILALNKTSFSLIIVPEQLITPEVSLKKLFELIDLTEKQKQKAMQVTKRNQRSFKPVIIKNHLKDDEVAKIAVHRHLLAGIKARPQSLRHYPFQQTTAHVLGYVSRMNERDTQRLKDNKTFRYYAGTEFIGKKGIERSQEYRLHGKAGFRYVETNALGRIVQTLENYPATPGKNLRLTVDLSLQKIAMEALSQHRKGAVVAMDPWTGSIKAMASFPAFDNNLFVTGISQKDYDQLSKDSYRPLFNRAVQGQYPPASTIKPFYGLLGLSTGTVTPEQLIYDPGYYMLPNYSRRFRDWKRTGHGFINLHDSIVQSCDTYFYDLGIKLGINSMHDFLNEFHFGQPTGIELQGESIGLIPSETWKKNQMDAKWFPGETLIAAIGQGYMLATPLQLAVATSGLATQGLVMKPRLIDAVQAPPVQEWRTKPPEILTKVQPDTPISTTHWKFIHESLVDAVHGQKATGKKAATGLDFKVAGKTGTAQVVEIPQGEEYDPENLYKNHLDHALFVGYAPAESPQIVVAIIVENGGSGGAAAAPIAQKIFQHHLSKPQVSLNQTQ